MRCTAACTERGNLAYSVSAAACSLSLLFLSCLCLIRRHVLNTQVTTGGNFDVDASVMSPLNQTVYLVTRKPSGRFQWNADATGAYRLCFSNRFSSISHKTVSFDFGIIDNSTLDEYSAADDTINYVSRLQWFLCSFLHWRLAAIAESVGLCIGRVSRLAYSK